MLKSTALDALWGYSQVPIKDDDKNKSTFIYDLSTQRYTCISFGLQNAPATFQRALNVNLSGARWKTYLIYTYVVVIFSKNNPHHLKDLIKY